MTMLQHQEHPHVANSDLDPTRSDSRSNRHIASNLKRELQVLGSLFPKILRATVVGGKAPKN